MNWKCLFGHKWNCSNVTLTHTISYGPKNSRNKEYKSPMRICERCYKKQRRSFNPNKNWIDMDLTKSEKRDKKLKELGL